MEEVVGRDAEREALVGRLRCGAPTVVVGPAGIGKSTLGREALARAPGRWAEATGLASLRWSPFVAFRRLLAGASGESPEEVAAQVLARAPGALLVDDVQWLDEASLVVVALVAAQMPILATARSGDDGSERAVGALAEAGFHRLDLAPLPRPAAERLAARLHPDLGPDARRRLVDLAGGNPLLLAEMASGREASPTLARALHARLRDLPVGARDAMARLSVLGHPADPALLGPGTADLLAHGLARERHGLVEVHHALLAEAVVADLGQAADAVRRALVPHLPHAEAAHVLAALGDRASAREAALRAAEDAPSRRERATAMALAVRCAPEGDPDVARRLAAAQLLLDTGDATSALALVAEADLGRADLDRRDRGRLATLAAAAAWDLGRPEEFTGHAEEAVRSLSGTRTEDEVLILAWSTVYDTRVALDGRRSLDRAQQAVALADELGVGQGHARARLASVLLTTGDPGWAELYERAVADADAAGDDELRLTVVNSFVLAQWVAGDAEAGRRLAHEHTARGPRREHDKGWLGLASYAALLDVLLGSDRAGAVERWAPVLDAHPFFRSRPFLEAAVALGRSDLGRHDEAAAQLEGAEVRAGQDPQWRSVVVWAEVEAAWLAGRPEDALLAGERVRALGVGDYPSAVVARLVAAHAALDLGRAPEGPPPVPRFPAFAAAPAEWEGIARWSEGRWEDATTAFDAAAAAWAGHDVRSEARCAWASGEAARRGGAGDAVARLERAERLVADSDLRSLARRVHRSLRAAGVARAAPRGRGTAGLSAREEEVMLLVGEGRTSTQIGSELGIARATVDTLVASAVRKLGATNRRNAAAILRRARS